MAMNWLLNTGNAQYYFESHKYYSGDFTVETGISTGIMNCLTDIGGKKGIGKNLARDINWEFSRPVLAGYSSITFRHWLGLRFQMTAGTVTAHDSVLKKYRTSTHGRYERNLGFRSRIIDLHLAVEFHPLFLFSHEDEPPYLSPYFIGGIGMFFFDPKAKMDGKWHRLQPLRTEGQGFREYPERLMYKLREFNFPMGIGLRYELGSFTYLRWEIVHRILNTDYLDDVSKTYIENKLFHDYHSPETAAVASSLANRSIPYNSQYAQAGDNRGNDRNNDSFFTIEIKLGLVIKRKIRN